MTISITWTITAIIAVSSFLSPIAVAIINNRHHARIRKLELDYDKSVRLIDLNNQAAIRKCDIYYADKKQAFECFAESAGKFSMSRGSTQTYEKLHSAIDTALLFSDSGYDKLVQFQKNVDSKYFGATFSLEERIEYSKQLSTILSLLNKELESTKPAIDCETREC